MGIINVLDIHVANLIAAGEVVERPASAVKELVENSIDAEATKITVEIKNGGVSFIRVCDNGKGMSREDVPVSIKRHATSKISNQWDLGKITTLGFRGEALAAISSVAKVRIMTKRREDRIGTLLVSEPGESVTIVESGCPDGTTVIVEELFANVPARRKFLKKDMTEGMAVSNAVEKLALSRPDISVKFISDGTVRFCTAGDNKLINVIYALYGREFARKLTSVDWMTEGVKVTGYIGNPDNIKNNRNGEIVFVNDRYVRNKTVSAALEQAFDSYIPEGKFPCCVIRIEVHPAFVDANVHPSKAEVKFSDERQIFDAVYSTVRGALRSRISRPELAYADGIDRSDTESVSAKKQEGLRIINSFVPVEERAERAVYENLSFNNPGEKTGGEQDHAFQGGGNTPDQPGTEYDPDISVPVLPGTNRATNRFDFGSGGISERPFAEKTEPEAAGQSFEYTVKTSETEDRSESGQSYAGEDYRIIGEAFCVFIIVEMSDRLIVIDKHAAHERMIFENLKSNMHKENRGVQFLMIPIEVPLDSVERATAIEYCDEISAVGFDIRWEENGRVKLYGIPAGMDTDSAADLFSTICDRISEGMGNASLSRDITFEKALYQASCKAAIKAGRPDSEEDTAAFVKKFLSLPDIKYCPHGRPVAFEVTKDALEKQFKRK